MKDRRASARFTDRARRGRAPDAAGRAYIIAGQPMLPPLSLRIGVAAAFDPRDKELDSGVCGSMFEALGEVVAQAVPLSGELPPRLGRAAHLASVAARMRPRDVRDPRRAAKGVHAAAQLGRPTIAARNRLLRRRLAAAGTQ